MSDEDDDASPVVVVVLVLILAGIETQTIYIKVVRKHTIFTPPSAADTPSFFKWRSRFCVFPLKLISISKFALLDINVLLNYVTFSPLIYAILRGLIIDDQLVAVSSETP